MAGGLNLSISDDKGKQSTYNIGLPNGFTKADYGEAATQFATLVDAITAGRVESAQLCLEIDLSSLTGNTLQAGADVEEKAEFIFNTAAQENTEVNIPAFDEDNLVVAGSDNLDLANVDVAAFVTGMEDGFSTSGSPIQPTDIDENDIDTLLTARERFTASGSYKRR